MTFIDRAAASSYLLPRVVFAMLLAAVAMPAAAQVPASLQAEIERTQTALEDAGLDETQRQQASDLVSAAATAERDANATVATIDTLRADAQGAPVRTRRLQDALATTRDQAVTEWRERLPDQADAETLEQLLEQERSTIAQLRSEIDAAAAELAKTLSGPGPAAGEMADLRRRIDELSTPFVEDDAQPTVLGQAARLRRAAEVRQLQAELELRRVEQDTSALRQGHLELALRSLRHQLGQHEARLAILQQRIVDLRREALEAQADALAMRAADLAPAGGAVATEALQNEAIGAELVQVNERLASERRRLAELHRARDRASAALRDSRTRLDLGAGTDQVGRWLWSERRALEAPAGVTARLADLRGTLGELRLRLVTLTDQQRDLADLPAAVDRVRTSDPTASEEEEGHVAVDEAALAEVLSERGALLDQLEPLVRRRIATQEQSEREMQQQLEATIELQQMLDRHLLWIASHEPAGAAWLSRIPAGLYDLVKPSRWLTTAQLVANSLRERPLAYLGSALAVLVLLMLRRRARPRLDVLAQAIRSVRVDRYARTLEALGWTIVAALPWAVAAFFGGQLLQGVGEAGKYSDSLGRALVALSLPILTLDVLRWMSRERGLGHAHFRWTRPRREALQRWLPPLSAVALLAYFVMALAFIRNQDLAIDVQARLAIVLLALTSAFVVWRLLAPGRLWSPRGMTVEPSGQRRVLRVLLPGLLVACAILAMVGYVYSTAILVNAQFASIGVIVVVAIVHGLLARWFLLGERRLALHRLEQRREAEAGSADAEAGEAMPEPDAEVTLEAVGAQSRRLLRALKLTLLIVGLAIVWADVLPAFARLDEIALWQFTDVGPDGATIRSPVTLIAVMFGTLVLVLTVVAARNLPGLLEIGLLSRAHIDAASRYAITSVSRYAIVIAGTVIGLGLLGLRWSQLQWMAAALSVGLGFGLQEIFANFVSGLILLFERPFRVGDVITIGELSGTVTRIRTRATTILDFDNKEIVVPNKTFITGQLINWTLSDTTTRITIKVGVAYGSDVARVHELLMQAATENPRVLHDPAPRSWLLAFGASSLDFELRVFVGTLGDRLAVQNELNGSIAELTRANGIEIAFPQMDLHVRDLPMPPGEPAASNRDNAPSRDADNASPTAAVPGAKLAPEPGPDDVPDSNEGAADFPSRGD